MQSVTFLIPGDLESRTGGYGYDRRIVEELRNLGWAVEVRRLDGSFPFPTASARAGAAAELARLDDDALVLVDGLAFGAMADEAERERGRLRLIALVHHPLANETGIDAASAERFVVSERRALACARRVVVTSRATVRSLAPFGVARERIVVVEPGTDPAPIAHGSGSSTLNLLCVASVTPRKGYEVLIRALSTLTQLPWRLTCVGSLDRAPDTAARVRTLVDEGGIGDRVTFVGELGEESVAARYADADLFVLPTFHEGYGMVVAEAIARGLPVISTPAGAVPELVGERAGILVPAGDVAALSAALRAVLTDPALRERLREGALEMRQKLPSWRQSAATMAEALEL
jgi:glycosyltransferase involved in cell wall biosynthesis